MATSLTMRGLPALARAGSPLLQSIRGFEAGSSKLPGDSAGYSQLAIRTEGVRAGPAGRHAVSGVRATVFGGAGFLGRYVINQLGKIGSQVIVPYRCTDENMQHLRVMGDLGQMVFVHDRHLLKNEDLMTELCANSNIVINLLGKDHESANYGFSDVNVRAAEVVARAAAAAGAERLLHVSAVGASPSAASANLRTKFEGEAAVRAAFPGATIFRPAPMVGVEDRLSNHMATAMKKLPFLPLVDGGGARFRPAYVTDVALAMVASLHDESTVGGTYELEGPDEYTLDSFSLLVRDVMREKSARMPVPGFALKAAAAPGEWVVSKGIPLLPFMTTSFTSDYVNKWSGDLLATPKAAGFEALGIEPRKVNEGLPIEHIRSYRVGGYDHGTTSTAI